MDTPREIGRRILVPLDGSALAELALPQAAALASPEARVTLLRVVVPPSAGEDGDPELSLVSARQQLEDAAGRLYALAPELNVDVAVLIGRPGAEIARFAEQRACDLILMASFGEGGIHQWTFGSVAGQVVRSARVPVLIVRPQDAAEVGPRRFGRLLVPLDGSTRAEQSLPIARALVRRLRVPVHLVSVIDPDRAGFPDSGGTGPYSAVWQEIRDALHAEAQEALTHAARSLTPLGVTATWEVREGPTVAGIRAVTRPGDLIVLTSHARSNPPQWPQGSVGEQLVRTADVPIVLYRFAQPSDIVVPLSAESEPARQES